MEGLEGLAGVGGDAVFDLVPAVGGPIGLVFGCSDGNLEANLHGEGVDLGLGEFGQPGCGSFTFGAEGGSGLAVGFSGGFEPGLEHLEDFVAVFDLGELARRRLRQTQ